MATSMKCSMHALPISSETPNLLYTLHLKWCATPACRGSIWLHGASIYGYTRPAIQLHRDIWLHMHAGPARGCTGPQACSSSVYSHIVYTYFAIIFNLLHTAFTYTSLYTNKNLLYTAGVSRIRGWFADMLANYGRALLIQVQRG